MLAVFKGFCIRCDIQQQRKVYEACALQAGRSWLSSGIDKRDGLWGLGCAVCAAYSASGRKCRGGRFEPWDAFQVRPMTRWHAKESIESHHGPKSHRVASGTSRTKHESRHAKPARAKPQRNKVYASGDTRGGSRQSVGRGTASRAQWHQPLCALAPRAP